MGLAGDGHNDAVHHGGRDGAVCLFSLELIEALKAEGHSVFPGATGENLTVTGLDWSGMVPGSRWTVGDEVELEITSYTTPCRNQVGWFLESDYGRINQKLRPGWSRVYARVLSEGQVRSGDPVRSVSRSAL
jgi:MOSC domain-containing protein YiiM